MPDARLPRTPGVARPVRLAPPAVDMLILKHRQHEEAWPLKAYRAVSEKLKRQQFYVSPLRQEDGVADFAAGGSPRTDSPQVYGEPGNSQTV